MLHTGSARAIVVVEHLGGPSLLDVQIDGIDGLVTVEQRGKTGFAVGQTINLRCDPQNTYLFDGASKRV